MLSACRPEGSVDGPDVLGLSAGAASGGTSHAFRAVGERAGRRDGANVACRGTRPRAGHVVVDGGHPRLRRLPGRLSQGHPARQHAVMPFLLRTHGLADALTIRSVDVQPAVPARGVCRV
ncbi:hypothetical protein SNL152K_2235 [Streptomyces sp. NL15-2K]|nr:hypothetical protein SNL152K_2235 [Streptomyces sp. NL15-2K]